MAKLQALAQAPIKTQQPHPDYERFVREGNFSEFIWQIKHDGVRTLFDPTHREFYSRSGKVFPNFHVFLEEAVALHHWLTIELGMGDFHLDGEVAGETFTSVMNQLFKETDVDMSDLDYHVFDFTHPTLTFRERHRLLYTAFSDLQLELLKPVPYFPCPTFGSAEVLEEFVRGLMAQGHEGCVFKRYEGRYLFGKKWAGEWVKGVLDETLDLEVMALIPGEGKLTGCVGAFLCTLEGAPGNQVEVAPGRATHAQLRQWWENPDEAPKLIEVLFKKRTKDGSLRHPRFKRARDDK